MPRKSHLTVLTVKSTNLSKQITDLNFYFIQEISGKAQIMQKQADIYQNSLLKIKNAMILQRIKRLLTEIIGPTQILDGVCLERHFWSAVSGFKKFRNKETLEIYIFSRIRSHRTFKNIILKSV